MIDVGTRVDVPIPSTRRPSPDGNLQVPGDDLWTCQTFLLFRVLTYTRGKQSGEPYQRGPVGAALVDMSSDPLMDAEQVGDRESVLI